MKKKIIWLATAVALLAIIGVILFQSLQNQPPQLTTNTTGHTDATQQTQGSATAATQDSTGIPAPPPAQKVSTATLGAMGDILLHDLVIKSGYDSLTKSYNYDNIFKYLSSYAAAQDWVAANLEVTLCGDDNGYDYAGYPCFNAPDQIVDSLKNAGFDMLLTANNHSYDTRHVGLLRTQQTIIQRELAYIGTRQDASEDNFLVQDVNGISIGMVCYTYSTGISNGKVTLNGIPLKEADAPLVNYFTYGDLDAFYEKLSGQMEKMKQQGAEAIVLYIHWGQEYKTQPNATQKKMAQALCDLGVDVIVGNHAHVIQPLALFSNSQNPEKKTLCLYSTGNAVSNIYKVGNFPVETEDGLLFSVTFCKYSDGTVLIEGAQVLPTWVYRYNREDGRRMFTVLPLDGSKTPQAWQEAMSLSNSVLKKCQSSYERTMDLVGAGLTEINTWCQENQAALEQSLGIG